MDYLKPFLPVLSVATFVAGYVLSNFDRFRESRRKLRNMKMILYKEMSENYKLLNPVVPMDEKEMPDASLVAVYAERFSFAVYDRYLDRLDQLPTNDLAKVYEACAMLKSLQSYGNAFLIAFREADAINSLRAKDNIVSQATLIVSLTKKCHKLLAQALGVMHDGSSFLRAQEGDRGSAHASARTLPKIEARDLLDAGKYEILRDEQSGRKPGDVP